MTDAGILIAWRRSPALRSAAKHEMQFVSHIISMGQKVIRPSPDKWAAILVATSSMCAGITYGYDHWQSFISRISWFVELRSGLLATFDHV